MLEHDSSLEDERRMKNAEEMNFQSRLMMVGENAVSPSTMALAESKRGGKTSWADKRDDSAHSTMHTVGKWRRH